MDLPPRLAPIVQALLRASTDSREVSLDAIGDAIGVVAVSTDDVDAIMTALEQEGRRVVGPEGQRGERNLRVVLAGVRALTASLGRKPTLREIVAHTSLSEADVRHALSLGSVMGR
jgi:hypothetical protein